MPAQSGRREGGARLGDQPQRTSGLRAAAPSRDLRACRPGCPDACSGRSGGVQPADRLATAFLRDDRRRQPGRRGRRSSFPTVICAPAETAATTRKRNRVERRPHLRCSSGARAGRSCWDGYFRHEPQVDAPSPRHITGRALRDTWSQRRRERRPDAGGVPARGPPKMVSELDEWFHVEKLRLAPLTR